MSHYGSIVLFRIEVGRGGVLTFKTENRLGGLLDANF